MGVPVPANGVRASSGDGYTCSPNLGRCTLETQRLLWLGSLRCFRAVPSPVFTGHMYNTNPRFAVEEHVHCILVLVLQQSKSCPAQSLGLSFPSVRPPDFCVGQNSVFLSHRIQVRLSWWVVTSTRSKHNTPWDLASH